MPEAPAIEFFSLHKLSVRFFCAEGYLSQRCRDDFFCFRHRMVHSCVMSTLETFSHFAALKLGSESDDLVVAFVACLLREGIHADGVEVQMM